jgi:hypothetical protein
VFSITMAIFAACGVFHAGEKAVLDLAAAG